MIDRIIPKHELEMIFIRHVNEGLLKIEKLQLKEQTKSTRISIAKWERHVVVCNSILDYFSKSTAHHDRSTKTTIQQNAGSPE